MNNAMVNVPLEQVDKLRNDLAKSQEKVIELEKKQFEVKVSVFKRNDFAYSNYATEYYREGNRHYAKLVDKTPKVEVIDVSYHGFKEIREILIEDIRKEFEDKIEKLDSQLKDSQKLVFKREKEAKENFENQKENYENIIKELKGEAVEKDKDDKIATLQATVERYSKELTDLLKENEKLTSKLESKNGFQKLFGL